MRLLVVSPVFNDWPGISALLASIDQALQGRSVEIQVLLIDDGSSDDRYDLPAPISRTFKKMQEIRILKLGRNLGHQRAIAVGLAYAAYSEPVDAVLVMDSDGEDDPAEIPKLLEEYERTGGSKIIFAARARRSEGAVFKALYSVYQVLFYVLAGTRISVGNYSVIPIGLVKKLSLLSELWIHFPAAVLRSRIPWTTVPTSRSKRISGKSKMSFSLLVLHGLSALAVNSDIIGVRVLLAAFAAVVAIVGAIVSVVCIKFFTTLAIPGWASVVVITGTGLLLQVMTGALLLAFLVLERRGSITGTPAQFYKQFVIEDAFLFSRGPRSESEAL